MQIPKEGRGKSTWPMVVVAVVLVVGLVIGLGVGYLVRPKAETAGLEQEVSDLGQQVSDLQEQIQALENSSEAIQFMLTGGAPIAGIGGGGAGATAVEIFLKVPDIEGGSTAAGHKGWIDIFSYSHNMNYSTGSVMPTHEEFVITKYVDKSSPYLYLAVNTGEHFDYASVEVVSPDGSSMKYNMTDVMATGVKVHGPLAGSFTHMEEVSFVYTKIRWVYIPVSGSPITAGWDVVENKIA